MLSRNLPRGHWSQLKTLKVRDVSKRLQSIDGQYVQGFDRRLRQGLCPPHWIDLNFGAVSNEAKQSKKAYLLLTGWILPTDTSLNIQIDQNPELPAIEFPSVWVPEGRSLISGSK